MSQFTKLLVLVLLAAIIVLPFVGNARGWGMGSEKNLKVVNASESWCPPELTRTDGTCQRTVRSYYFGRSVVGGGPNYGK